MTGNESNVVRNSFGNAYSVRHPDPAATSRLYVAYPVEQHQAGNQAAQGTVQTRIQVPPQRQEPPRETRYRSGKIPQLHIREWMFLARPQRMPEICPAENQ